MIEGLGYGGLVLRECAGLYGGLLLGRTRLDLPRLVRDLHELGLSLLPAVSLVSLAVGLIVAIQTQALLGQVNLPALTLGTVASVAVREFAPLLIGILVVGRAGVSLAVRIATMSLRGEIQGLLVSGVNPVHYTAGTGLLAMLWMAFALTVWADLLVLSSAGGWLIWQGGVSASLFLDALTATLSPGDLLVSVVKPLLFSVLMTALAAWYGGQVERAADGVARAATQTLVAGVALVLGVDLLFSVLGL